MNQSTYHYFFTFEKMKEFSTLKLSTVNDCLKTVKLFLLHLKRQVKIKNDQYHYFCSHFNFPYQPLFLAFCNMNIPKYNFPALHLCYLSFNIVSFDLIHCCLFRLSPSLKIKHFKYFFIYFFQEN